MILESPEQIKDTIEASKSIPLYEFKVTPVVEGFDDFVVGDFCTFKITVKRAHVGRKEIGLGHSLTYPGMFNECVQICVINGPNLLQQEKLKITGKVSTFDFKLSLGEEGKIPLVFDFRSTCYYGVDGKVELEVPVVKMSQQRNEALAKIEKRKVKLGLSFFQQALKEAGMLMVNEDDEEEEEEEEPQQHNNNNSQMGNNGGNNNQGSSNSQSSQGQKTNINIEGKSKID